jgi:hypothetical protein
MPGTHDQKLIVTGAAGSVVAVGPAGAVVVTTAGAQAANSRVAITVRKANFFIISSPF